MSDAGTSWVLAVTGWALLVGGIGTENMPALWIAMGIGAASMVLIWWWSRRKLTWTLSTAGRTRRDLVEAQVAIFENQNRDTAAGVHEETDEYHRLHEHYYALADRVPWWRRIGVWHAALAEHDRRCRGGVRR